MKIYFILRKNNLYGHWVAPNTVNYGILKKYPLGMTLVDYKCYKSDLPWPTFIYKMMKRICIVFDFYIKIWNKLISRKETCPRIGQIWAVG